MTLTELAERKRILEDDISHALEVLINKFIDDVDFNLSVPEIKIVLSPELDYQQSATCKYTKYFDASVYIKILV